MRPITRIYSISIAALATVCLLSLYMSHTSVSTDSLVAVAVLCGVAAGAELLQYALPRGARGSIAFVPYLSCVILAPYWPTPVAILVVKLATELARRVGYWKTFFNVSQHVLAVSLSVLLYRALRGPSLLEVAPISLLHATTTAGLASIVAIIACYFVNGILVAGAISLDTATSVGAVWKEVKNPTAASLDVLAAPLVFVFAWIYASFGPIAAVAAWVPFIGYRHAHKTNLELEQTNRELLELMVKSLEARDPYTSGHSRRVQRFSTKIASALGLHAREIEKVGRAALLHDVGKIHEKYAPILSKTDRLTPDEWKTMKEHPGDGADLTATMTKLQDIVPAIRHHHENWDGTGYPDGLAGELIPLASRIIRFADTIDAMTTERPYRSPLTETQVRTEIVRFRGTQFDPQITDKLLSNSLWFELFRPVKPNPEDASVAKLTVISGSAVPAAAGQRRSRNT
jgi:putative nucleotidyltransferase with HDIG domain